MINLKIRQTELNPGSARVWLGGHEISHGLSGVEVSWDVDKVTRATLKILVDDLDVDAQTLAYLEAHVRESAA